MLEIRNLSVKYDDNEVLHDCSLDLNGGHIYALVGENGSGKTTFIGALTKNLEKSSGTISYKGVDIEKNYDFGLDSISLDEVMIKNTGTLDSLVHELKELKKTMFSEEYYRSLLMEFGLNGKMKLSKMSLGQKRLGNFICSLSFRPKIIVLDEYFDGVDVINKSKLKRLLYSHIESVNGLVILATHNMAEIEDVCDKIIFLKDGNFTEVKDIEEALNTLKKIQIFNVGAEDENNISDILGNDLIYRNFQGAINFIISSNRNSKDILSNHNYICSEMDMPLEEIIFYEFTANKVEKNK